MGFVWFNSNIYYINDHLDKRTWTYIFGACCATTVFIPSFHNYRIWSFLGLGMTTYTAWYLTIAALVHGQVDTLLICAYIESVCHGCFCNSFCKIYLSFCFLHTQPKSKNPFFFYFLNYIWPVAEGMIQILK